MSHSLFNRRKKKKLSLLFTVISVMTLTLNICQGASTITNDAECSSCLGAGSAVCRAETNDQSAFCCDETEIGSSSCGGTTAFCSTMSLNPVINSFACPYSKSYCVAKNSELIMHPSQRNNLTIEISNRLYVDTETCYYVFSVNSQDLDKNFKYFWDVDFYLQRNIVAQLNNGTSLFTANDPITISGNTGTCFQYDAENNKVYLAITASVASGSTEDPAFGFKIKLRSFDTQAPEPEPEGVPAENKCVVVTPTVPPDVTPTVPPDVTPTVPPDEDAVGRQTAVSGFLLLIFLSFYFN